MVQKRDEALAKTQRRAMAQLLEQGKVESARIRVENIIRTDIITELHEILELYCELLLARAGLLEASPTCDPGLEEAVKSIIYAAPKTEIKELHQVRLLLAEKFGKEFVLAAMENADGKVSDKVIKKLSVAPPKEELVQGYLEEIAKAYGVNWPRKDSTDLGEPPDFVDSNEDGSSGGEKLKGNTLGDLASAEETRKKGDGVEEGLEEDSGTKAREALSKATPPTSFGPTNPVQVNPPSPSTDNIHPKVTLNKVELTPTRKSATGNGFTVRKLSDADDELARRFAALKR